MLMAENGEDRARIQPSSNAIVGHGMLGPSQTSIAVVGHGPWLDAHFGACL